MHVRITEPVLKEVVFESTLPTDFITERPIEHLVMSLDHPLVIGKGEVSRTWFEGVHLVQGHLQLVNDVKLNAECDTAMMEMHFSLSGSSASVINDGQYHFEFGSGEHNLFYMPAFEGNFHNRKQETPNRFMEINLTEKWFKRLVNESSAVMSSMAESMEKKQPGMLGQQHMKITPQMQMIVESISACNKTGTLQRLFIESKVMELLMLQVEQFEHGYSVHKTGGLKAGDKEKIFEAKRIIEQKVNLPFTLADLSRQVGLNDFKLKKGFRETFGTTVFGYLLDLRMEQARNMLLSTSRSIAEISDEVGYKNPQHFTAAFKRKFGVTPTGLKK